MKHIIFLVDSILIISVFAFVISMFVMVFNMDIGLVMMKKSALIMLGTIMLDLLLRLRM